MDHRDDKVPVGISGLPPGVNFKKSGALLPPQQFAGTDGKTILKYVESATPDRFPAGSGWSLHVFKEDQAVEVIHLDPNQSCFRIGRLSDVNPIVTAHASCSAQHAVLQFRKTRDQDIPSR